MKISLNLNHLYWGIIAFLGSIHLHAGLLTLPVKIPIYLTMIIVIAIVYFLYKKIPLNFTHLRLKWDGTLLIMQILLVLIYFSVQPSWIYLVPLLLFIALEGLHIAWNKQISIFSKRLKQFEDRSSHFNETFRIVRSERHDFLKHVSAIHYLLEHERNQEAKDYLDQLVDGYEETNLSIKGERGVVAGVLHQVYRRAKGSGIEVVYDFDLPLSTLPLSDQEMVTFVGNLLSNSLDACEEWQQQTKKQGIITLQFYKRSGLYIFICKNNSLPIPAEVLDQLFKTYGHTTKKGDHQGLGTKMIHEVVKKHGGFLDFIYKDQEFAVKTKIPAIR